MMFVEYVDKNRKNENNQVLKYKKNNSECFSV